MTDPCLDPVSFAFNVLDGPDPDWQVRRLHWRESISEPYEIVVELISTETFIHVDDLLGAGVELTIERKDTAHVGHGLILRIDEIGVASEQLAVRAYVVPALQLLAQRVDTRIFQAQTVPEILDAVLGPALAEYGREVDTSKLQSRYQPRDCCVQYGESDLDFCSRLMEDEGIAYAFEPDLDNRRETLVLFDANPVGPSIDDEVPLIATRWDHADRESLRRLDLVRRECTTKVSTRGFNWKVPTSLAEGHAQADEPRGRARELYLFDDRRQVVDDPLGDPRAEHFTGEAYEQHEVIASRRLQLEHRWSRTLEGESNVTGFAAGLCFTLGDHRNDELAGHDFLLTQVIHTGDAPERELGERASEGPRYTNTFECLPAELPFRPSRRTRRPRVHGPTTAIVVGPPDNGEDDIHTDQHGRIKVRFHWDRLSPPDERASCWVRVAQLWAGNGWGGMFIPRVGMEVVVDFLDGNPDRPLVIGCVYNGRQRPPYTLPDDKTKSTIKTASSPGGEGFNELRFEDAKGSEQIYLHAQKDLDEVVLGNHSAAVGGDQHIEVDGRRRTTISGDRAESIGGEQTLHVAKNLETTIAGSQRVSVGSGAKLDITGDYALDTSNAIAIQAPTEIRLSCGDSTLTMAPGRITLSAGGSATLVLDADALIQSAAGTKVVLDANAQVSSSGGSQFMLDANAQVSSSGGSQVLLDANVLATSSAASQLLLDTNAQLVSPGTATVSAPTASLAGAGGSVKATGAGLTCAGGQVSVSGGLVNVSGGLVKIN